MKLRVRLWFGDHVWRWQLAIANHLPRWIVYWATIRLGAHATTGQYSSQVVPELYFMDALERWGK